MAKELKVDMYLYMKYEGEYSQKELENKIYKLLYEFTDRNGMDFVVNETEIQDV